MRIRIFIKSRMVFSSFVFLFLFNFIIFNLFCNNDNLNESFYGSSLTVNYLDTQNNNVTKTKSINPTMEKYYKNLNNCFGRNINGSCGYIAIQMLLSYYDTFYNDDLIDEVFEYQITPSSLNNIILESPGTRMEIDYNLSTVSEATNFYRYFSSTYFMSYLICLCMDNPEINYYNLYNITFGTNNPNYICALDYGHIGNILDFYLDMQNLDNDFLLDSSHVDFSNMTRPLQNSNVISFIKNNLDMGYPVLVCTEPTSGGGHAQIVHSYQCVGNNQYTFYAHKGWLNASTSSTIINSDITEAYTLIPQNGASGSDNYANFVDNVDNNLNLTNQELQWVSNSKNLWEKFKTRVEADYYRGIFDEEYVNQIISISYYGFLPQTFYVQTDVSYDTIFSGTNIVANNYYMLIFEDINPDPESDFQDLNAWVRISINNYISTTFNPTFYIGYSYERYLYEVVDYLYTW